MDAAGSHGTWWRCDGSGIVVDVRVAPGARRSEVIAGTGDRLRIRVAAPAVDDKANVELQRFLAATFGVRAAAVEIVTGRHARQKAVRIAGVTAPPPALLAGRAERVR